MTPEEELLAAEGNEGQGVARPVGRTDEASSLLLTVQDLSDELSERNGPVSVLIKVAACSLVVTGILFGFGLLGVLDGPWHRVMVLVGALLAGFGGGVGVASRLLVRRLDQALTEAEPEPRPSTRG